MSGPIYGGNDPSPDKQLRDDGPGTKGVYAAYPAATPKYNAGNHLFARDETQARLYIEIADLATYNRFLAAIPPEARPYAEAMTQVTGSAGGKGYLDFFLVSAQEPVREKVQVSEVLSDAHIAYFFGQSAPVWNYQIGLINSQQDEWYDAWTIVYENILRGTRLAENRVAVTLAYDTRRVVGSLISSQTGLNAANEIAVLGGFSILVKEVQIAATILNAPPDFVAVPRDLMQLNTLDDIVKQIKTDALQNLEAERERARTPTAVEDLYGLKPGYNPEEVEEKTGVKLSTPEDEALYRIGVDRFLPPSILVS